ncbi:aminotransferase-like domain-containing protein [Variovorax sp. HW608]|uniref:aminotransferase-like domain-containing protein n=1 Tax=Variovorax sp. HW608 TaxID=1034889 RepID=UPI0012FDF02B|nr:PLP-dependent aminotransferase family protein [Variovorax sp. HW608]
MISFAGGYPDPGLMDAQGLQACLAQLEPAEFARALEYGGTEGDPSLRAELARLSRARGLDARPEDVQVLSGSQQGIDLLARTLLCPGDTVLVEAPTYPAALSAFRFAGATVHQVPMDQQGLDIAALEFAMAAHKPKLLYTVPTFGNPTGLTLAAHRRQAVAELAVRYQCLVIEDDPYGELYFDQAPPAPIHAARNAVQGAEEVLIYLASLSKTMAPGLRVGWMLGPAAIRRACVLAKQVDDMHASTLTQTAAARYLKSGAFERHLPTLRESYRARAMALFGALEEQFGNRIEMPEPQGGMFMWGRAPGVCAQDWLAAAIEHGVMFVPGAAFFAEASDPAFFRLSFATQDTAGMREGAGRLSNAMRQLRLR